MQWGATFPQTEIGSGFSEVREYAEAVEEMGYDYILAYDHVLGADLSVRPNWSPPTPSGKPGYAHTDMFHEPLTLFGYLAGVTGRIGLATGVLILGQRQTVLVAKQAAALDVFSGGRLRLGVGTGWNDVEYEALGMNWRDRGSRSEEQIELMRKLWTQDVVNFSGRWHTVVAAGINPLPVQRPIPIWFGGWADAVLQRCGRMGDGWYAGYDVTAQNRGAIDRLRRYTEGAGRDPSSMGIEISAQLPGFGVGELAAKWSEWRSAGVTHVTMNTMGAGLVTLGQHIELLRKFRDSVE